MMPDPLLVGRANQGAQGDQTYRSDKLYEEKLDRFLCPQLDLIVPEAE